MPFRDFRKGGFCVRGSTGGFQEGREADFALDVLCRLVDLELRLGLLAGVLCGTLPLLCRLGSLCVRTWRSAMGDERAVIRRLIRWGSGIVVSDGGRTYVAATHFEDCSGKLLVICDEEALSFDGTWDADVAVDGGLGGEAATAVGEKILGGRREGIGPETFWSGRILEAPCPSPLRLQGGFGHWTLADRRVSTLDPAQVGKPQGAHGP